jgi:hypothetical protein
MRTNESAVTVNARISSVIPLVRVLDLSCGAQAIVDAVRKIEAEGAPSEPVPPQDAKPFLAKAGEHGDECRCGEDAEVQESLTDECWLVPVRDCGHEISTDIAVRDVRAGR